MNKIAPYYHICFLIIVVYSGIVLGVTKCNSQFWCSNDLCIPTSHVCNGLDNCRDNSDERSCSACEDPSNETSCFECLPGTFLCPKSNGTDYKCVDAELVCDESCDCDTCEDEKGCSHDPPPTTASLATQRPVKPGCSSYFWCSNNRCVDSTLVCDGANQCGEYSDERSCIGCGSGSFSCNNGNSTHSDCIDPVLVCDKVCDCDTCEDEEECYYDRPWRPQKPKCFLDEFWCSNDRCVSLKRVCDDINACGDWSDERSCNGCRMGTFFCPENNGTNSNCIDADLVCDTFCDCETCEDEKDCYYNIPPRPTKPKCDSQFWCSNDQCTGISLVCDNINDCGDWSDERSCDGCGSGNFLCPNNNSTKLECIHPNLVCDKFCDCDTCEDEKDCYYDLPPRQPKPKCNSQFWCSNDRCISTSSVCNNFNMCGDWSDERSCSGCGRGNFLCPNNDDDKLKCINPDLVCDKFCDCDTCEDEKECYYDKTTTTMSTTRPPKPSCVSSFWCSNNNCVYFTSWVCDGFNDCGDNSDERSCQGCGMGTFSCQDGDSANPQCISPVLVCDKFCDCETCKDETECYYNLPSTTVSTTRSTTTAPRPPKPDCVSTFWCSNNKCLSPLRWVCDRFDDCGDNSDERSCQGCEQGTFSCQNGDSANPQCIDPVLVCDQFCDCETCKDETECYYNLPTPPTTTPGSNRPSGTTMVVSIVVSVCVVFLLVMITVCTQQYRSRKRSPSRDTTNTNLAYVTTEQQLQEQYQPEMDFPPEYETVNDGPVFSLSPSLFFNDSNDGLPAYNEINIPMSDHNLHGEVNASMTTEEEAEPPPPSYDTVADVFNTNIASTESSSTDGDSLRFRRSSSCYSSTVSHDL